MNEKSEQFDDVPLDSDSADQVHLAVNDAERALRAVPASPPCAVVDAASTQQDAPSWSWKHRALYQLMSDISEDCYCAGWMSGNEYTLWEMVANPSAPRNYGQGDVSDKQLADLLAMSREIGGWIRWVDDDDQPDLPSEEWGPRFTPLADWLPMFERRMAHWAKLSEEYKGGIERQAEADRFWQSLGVTSPVGEAPATEQGGTSENAEGTSASSEPNKQTGAA